MGIDKVVDLDELPVVPRVFHQLGILVLDGSGSMTLPSIEKIPKAASVNKAVQELIGALAGSRVASNFSLAIVTFDDHAKVHTNPTDVRDLDSYGSYDPLPGHGGGTRMDLGLRSAVDVARNFLGDTHDESVPRSVVIVVLSDGMSEADPLEEAASIKQDPKITICTTRFASPSDKESDAEAAETLLRSMASTVEQYRTTYRGLDLRKFFIASVSFGRNIKIG
jgi:uncharacterized protein YegL